MSSLCEGSLQKVITRRLSPHTCRMACSTMGVNEVVMTNGKRFVWSSRSSSCDGWNNGWLKASPSMA